MSGYSYVDSAGFPSDRHFTLRYIVFVGGNLVSLKNSDHHHQNCSCMFKFTDLISKGAMSVLLTCMWVWLIDNYTLFLLSIVEQVSNMWMSVTFLKFKISCEHNMSSIYTYNLSTSYRVKENTITLARLLNFFKQLMVKIISESNGFIEFKIQWVLSFSW